MGAYYYFGPSPGVSTELLQRVRLLTRVQVEAEILQGEHDELTGPLAEAGDPFVQQALQLLEQRRSDLAARYIDETASQLLAAKVALMQLGSGQSRSMSGIKFDASAATAFGATSGEQQQHHYLPPPTHAGVEADDVSPVAAPVASITAAKTTALVIDHEVHTFYQAADGQPVFLHGINVKMLTEVLLLCVVGVIYARQYCCSTGVQVACTVAVGCCWDCVVDRTFDDDTRARPATAVSCPPSHRHLAFACRDRHGRHRFAKDAANVYARSGQT
jgi:hypothetical protein